MIGDDILIGDENLYSKYVATLNAIGVTFNKTKSHESERLLEFAKRLFYDGTEISPFPINSLTNQGANFYTLGSTLLAERLKGWYPNNGSTSKAVASFYNNVKGLSSSFCKRIQKRTFAYLLLMD